MAQTITWFMSFPHLGTQISFTALPRPQLGMLQNLQGPQTTNSTFIRLTKKQHVKPQREATATGNI